VSRFPPAARFICLVFHGSEATKDIDALLVPAREIRRAAQAVGEREEMMVQKSGIRNSLPSDPIFRLRLPGYGRY
jgi:hypothetical protein